MTNKYFKYLVLGLVVALVFLLADKGFFDKYLKPEQSQKSTHTTMDIYQCAQMGDFDCVKKKVESGADVNALSHKGILVLQAAALGGNADIVKYLVEKGADINAKGKGETTALHVSVGNGNVEATKTLLYLGADLKTRDAKNNTPACYIAQSNNIEILKLMLNYGTNLNSKCTQGYTVAQIVASGRNNDMLTVLKQKGFHANTRTKSDRNRSTRNPMIKSSQASQAKRKDYDLDASGQNPLNASPLHIAVAEGEIEKVKSLINQGANINTTNIIGDTPLHYATEYFFIEASVTEGIKKEVKNTGKPWQFVDHFGISEKILRERLEIVKILISAKSTVNAKNKYKETALHNIANINTGQEEINMSKQVLAEEQEEMFKKYSEEDKIRVKEAMYAGFETINKRLAESNKIIMEMARALMEAGIDVNAKDYNGMDAIKIAEFKYNTPLAEEIQKYKK